MKKQLMVLTLAAALTFGMAGCKAEQAANQTTAQPETTQMEQISQDSVAEDTESINSLISEENAIFEEHEALWDKVFDKEGKEKIQKEIEQGATYLEVVETHLEAKKDKFTEEEFSSLKEDLKKVAEIEEKINALDNQSGN